MSQALDAHVDATPIVFCVIVPALSAMCSLRSLSGLTPLSFVGSALVASAVAAVGFHAVPALQTEVPGVELARGGETLPIFFSMAVYCFEGIGLALPIENSMHKPTGFRHLWLTCMSVITSVYITFGCFGYAAYGAHTPSSITDTLPRHSGPSTFVKLGVCGCLFLTFPLMLFPVFEIVEARPPLSALVDLNVIGSPIRSASRALLVLLVACFATVIPDFGLVISLVGALGCNAIAFVLPTVFHLKIFYDRMGTWGRVRDGAVAIFGVVAMVVCTATTVNAIRSGKKTH